MVGICNRRKEENMPRDWELEVQKGLDDICTMRLKVGGQQKGEGSAVVVSCRSIDDFRQEIHRMKAELDEVLVSAQQKLDALQKGGGGTKAEDPAKIWKNMEAMGSDSEMFTYFNGFSASDREIIAEYVLTNVNMFKGRGPVFSEHYDASSLLLE
jgi:hypothetical protein